MAPIVSKVEIAGAPDEVVASATGPRGIPRQEHVVIGCMQGAERAGVGSRCITAHKIGGAQRTVTPEVMGISPTRGWAKPSPDDKEIGFQ